VTSAGAVDLNLLESVSRALRSLLWEVSPELVATAERFASQVIYLPVLPAVVPEQPDAEDAGEIGHEDREHQ
jgi:hypothetical protein